jgi:hypothetical protein
MSSTPRRAVSRDAWAFALREELDLEGGYLLRRARFQRLRLDISPMQTPRSFRSIEQHANTAVGSGEADNDTSLTDESGAAPSAQLGELES